MTGTIFESISYIQLYYGLLITDEHFSEDYLDTLFTADYDEELYYPLPAGISDDLMEFEKHMYSSMVTRRTYDDYNWHVWYNFYDTSLADYYEITDPEEILALNIDITERGDSHNPYDHGKCGASFSNHWVHLLVVLTSQMMQRSVLRSMQA